MRHFVCHSCHGSRDEDAKELFFLGEDIPANENSTKMNQNTIELNASNNTADYEKVEQSRILGDKISQKNTEQLINVEPFKR